MRAPSKLTPAVQAAICKAVEKGVFWKQAAQAGGVDEATLWRWRTGAAKAKSGVLFEFGQALQAAEARALELVAADLHSGLHGPQIIRKTKQRVVDGEIVTLEEIEEHGPDRRVQLEYLARRIPEFLARRAAPDERAGEDAWARTRAILEMT